MNSKCREDVVTERWTIRNRHHLKDQATMQSITGPETQGTGVTVVRLSALEASEVRVRELETERERLRAALERVEAATADTGHDPPESEGCAACEALTIARAALRGEGDARFAALLSWLRSSEAVLDGPFGATSEAQRAADCIEKWMDPAALRGENDDAES